MNIKKFINVLSVAGLLTASTVTPSSANTLEVKLNRQQVSGNTMQLLLEDVDLIAKAYQISLKITDNVKLDKLNFSHAGKSDVTSTYVYDEATNEVDIYVTSTKSLLDANDNLNIGSMTLNGTVGESFDVVPVADSLKIVTMANVEHSIPTVSVSGGSDFSIQDTNNSGSGGNNAGSGNTNNGGSTDGSGGDNTGGGNTSNGGSTGGTVDKPSNSDNKFTVDLEGLDEAIKEKVDSIVLEVVTKADGFILSVDGDKEDMSNVKDITVNSKGIFLTVDNTLVKVTDITVNTKGIFLTVDNTQVKVTGQLPATNIDFTNARAVRVINDKLATVSHYTDGDNLKITSNNLKDVLVTSRITAPFDDVAETDWYYDDVQDIFNYGITQGTTSTTYSPLANITRAQFATMIARALELTHTDMDSQYTLSDLTGKWYANEVQMLVNLGIITGYKDGTFGGENKLTRQQAVAMIVRMLEYMDVDTTPKGNVAFDDMDRISNYAKDAVQYLASHDVLNSGEGIKFNPYNNLTRAQMAKVLMRSLRLSDSY